MENPLHNGRWQLSQNLLREAIMSRRGLFNKKDRWPDQGLPMDTYDLGHGEFQFYVTQKNPPLGRGRGGMKHRAYVICPCGEHVPAGRMHQHLTKKGHP